MKTYTFTYILTAFLVLAASFALTVASSEQTFTPSLPSYTVPVGLTSSSEDSSHYILQVDKEDQRAVEQHVRMLNGTIINHLSTGDLIVALTATQKNELESQSHVKAIQSDRPFFLQLHDAVNLTHSTQANQLALPTGVHLNGSSQSVCVIDSGVDFTHPDLAHANVAGCLIDCTSGVCEKNCSAADVKGHGTHVAGTVAASGSLTGISPGAGIVGVKVFPDMQWSAQFTVIAAGIDWCVANKDVYNISVITMSLGTSTTYATREACAADFPSFVSLIQNAAAHDVPVVISSGNSFNMNGVSSPGCIEGAIPVDAVEKNELLSIYGNLAPWVKLAAPGSEINSTYLPIDFIGENANQDAYCANFNPDNYMSRYCSMSGTSMAAPMVAGAIAILKQQADEQGQHLTTHDYEMLLSQSGKKVEHYIVLTYDGYYLAPLTDPYNLRMIDVHAALLANDKTAPNMNLTYTNESDLYTYTCSAEDWQLNAISLQASNQTDLIYEDIRAVNGTNGTVVARLTHQEPTAINITCTAHDARNNAASQELNVVLGDVLAPEITWSSPATNISHEGDLTLDIIFSVNDSSSTTCDVILNGNVSDTRMINTTDSQTISHAFSLGTHTLSISCTDDGNHTTVTDTRTVEIRDIPQSSSSSSGSGNSGGGGGGSGSSRPRNTTLLSTPIAHNVSNEPEPTTTLVATNETLTQATLYQSTHSHLIISGLVALFCLLFGALILRRATLKSRQAPHLW